MLKYNVVWYIIYVVMFHNLYETRTMGIDQKNDDEI